MVQEAGEGTSEKEEDNQLGDEKTGSWVGVFY